MFITAVCVLFLIKGARVFDCAPGSKFENMAGFSSIVQTKQVTNLALYAL